MRETLDFLLNLHDLIPNDVTTKVRMTMMVERMFKLSNKEEIENFKCHYHTHEVSVDIGQSQIRLTYNDFI